MSTAAAPRRLLSVREVAARLRVSERQVRRLIPAGALPALKLGRKRAAVRVDERELEAWLYGRGAP